MAVTTERVVGDTALRPFRFETPGADLEQPRARIAARGGHFAAWEQPQLLSEDVRATFRSLRWR